MSQVQEYLDTFLLAVAETPGVWSSLDVRCIAVQADGQWHNLITRCRLDGRAPADVPEVAHLPGTEVFACRQMVLPIADLERFLRALAAGEVGIAGAAIAFRNLESDAGAPYSRGSAWVATRSLHKQDFERFPSAHRLTLYGGGQQLFKRADTDREKLDVWVSTLERPWDGLDSLTQYSLRTTTRIEYHGEATVEVVAPLEARLEHCELQAGTLNLVIATGSQAVADRCTVGLFGVQPGGGIVSETLPMPPRAWKAGADGTDLVCSGSHSSNGTHRATMLLRVGPFLVDRQTANDTMQVGDNPRAVAYAQFDEGLKRLTEIIQDPTTAKDEHEFHSAVARLFSFAGFIVDSFVADRSLTGRGIPDFLAYAPRDGLALIVECTTGSLATAKGKLSQLVMRAREVQEALTRLSGDRVVAVMVTSLADVPEHELDDARRSRVAVLTQRHLEELLHLAQDQAPLRTIVSWCQAHIPAKPPSSPLRGRLS